MKKKLNTKNKIKRNKIQTYSIQIFASSNQRTEKKNKIIKEMKKEKKEKRKKTNKTYLSGFLLLQVKGEEPKKIRYQ